MNDFCPNFMKGDRAVSEGLLEALKPFAEFGQYLLDHPRKGISEEMYGWDNAIFIRKSDLIRAAELERALESA